MLDVSRIRVCIQFLSPRYSLHLDRMFTNAVDESQSESPVEGGRKRAFRPHQMFSDEDDDRLRRLVETYGVGKWEIIAKNMNGRNPRQCRERWEYYLSPTLNHEPWSQEEDTLLLAKYKEYGSKWVRIAAFFRNRTDAMVKNRYHVIRRKQAKQDKLEAAKAKYTENKIENEIPLAKVSNFDNIEDIFSNQIFPDFEFDAAADFFLG